MGTFSTGRKVASFGSLILGLVLTIAGLGLSITGAGDLILGYMPINGTNTPIILGRGAMFVCGIILFFVGLYLFPTLKHHRAIVNIIFLFPLLFAFAVTVIIPLILGIGYSFTDWNGIKLTGFVGLANYARMFKQPSFLWSILLTFLFVVFNMILVNLVAFLLALLCTSRIKGLGFFRASYFLPNLIGGIVLGYIWQFIFSNVVTKFTGTYSMLSDTKTAFIAVIIVYIWQYAGYIMLIYITGLNTIPGDVLEASAIDGASPTQTLFNIKIPMIAPTITICTFLTLTSAFKQFDVNLALTNGKGSIDFLGNYIANGTEMLALNIYTTAVVNNDYALGQAKAVLFFIILAAVSIMQVRISNKKEVEL
ncbi:MAG: sugar ABC transporter permease [Butyrivibrio sp.]|jgi:raffinose/stachyose/melibiose transport system permease protein|nr:sugar ABC transporter permease [Butyrivibrio sp.]MBP3273560.1 sugar ABC transporter permease [Butyrivibrio sp.]MBP3278906.1 sugar ABC transporter permease [Butyrivibrio sp.]MBP3814734.1 sugar ABC transporter permease [Butyrivibrio sp.]